MRLHSEPLENVTFSGPTAALCGTKLNVHQAAFSARRLGIIVEE